MLLSRFGEVGCKVHVCSAFSLDGPKESLHHRIIPAVSFAAHADADISLLKVALIRLAGILAASIRMMQ
jgi:hypothetical protein